MSTNSPDLSEGQEGPNPLELLETTAQSLADKISNQARRIHGQEPKQVDWSEWSVADIEPKSPIKLGDLKNDFPDLARVLESPSGDVETDRDRIDDDTTIKAFGYWRNPDGSYTSLRFSLANSDDKPRTIRTVSFDRQMLDDNIQRTWNNIGLIPQSRVYYHSANNPMIKAVQQTEDLADKVIASGNLDASFVSHKEKVGQAEWEKSK